MGKVLGVIVTFFAALVWIAIIIVLAIVFWAGDWEGGVVLTIFYGIMALVLLVLVVGAWQS